jgi:glutamate synthase (ferredoxin)
VVILGKVGKNFAAGMSGGIAYVLDEENRLYRNLNRQLVQMESVASGAERDELQRMISRHVQLTGSRKGREILDSFESYLPRFKKIIPTDYRHMLTLIAKYEEQGIQHEQAVYEAFKESTKVGA